MLRAFLPQAPIFVESYLREQYLVRMSEAKIQSQHPFIHAGRVIAASALGGAVIFSLGLGWVPALAAVDMHAVGAAVGGLAALFSSARQLV